MPWPQGTHSAHITEKCVYEATCDKINVVQKELLNAEWVLEREINSPSIWPALPPQPQEVPLPPRRGGGEQPPHKRTPTCCRRGASPWCTSPLPASHLHVLAKMLPEVLAGSPIYPEWAFLSSCSLLPTCKHPDLAVPCTINHILE